MPKFRKKPVVIEAVQYDGKNPFNVLMFAGEIECREDEELYITTLEGRMHVSPGDWVIKGVNGEFYPCKPDIFEKTYELVE